MLPLRGTSPHAGSTGSHSSQIGEGPQDRPRPGNHGHQHEPARRLRLCARLGGPARRTPGTEGRANSEGGRRGRPSRSGTRAAGGRLRRGHSGRQDLRWMSEAPLISARRMAAKRPSEVDEQLLAAARALLRGGSRPEGQPAPDQWLSKEIHPLARQGRFSAVQHRTLRAMVHPFSLGRPRPRLRRASRRPRRRRACHPNGAMRGTADQGKLSRSPTSPRRFHVEKRRASHRRSA